MRLVDGHARVVRARDFDDRVQRRDVTVHREDRVSHDQAPAQPVTAVAVVAHAPLEVFDIEMPVDDDLGAGQPAAVHDRGVI